MAAEVAYGRRDHENELNDILSRDSKEGKKLYPIADAMLHDILVNVKEPTGYDFNLFILKTDDHNAIARPGGFVYLDAGLIKDPKLRPKAEFALAHEVAHVLQRHETLELQGLIVDSFAFRKDIAEAIAKMKNDPSSVLTRIRLDKNQYVRYHLDQELQADSCSARLLGRVYDDPLPLAKSLGAFLEDLPTDNAVTTTLAATTTGVTGATSVGAAPANQTLVAIQNTTAVTEQIVNEPARSHPSSLERRQNLTAVYQEVKSEIETRRLAAVTALAPHASTLGTAHGAHAKAAGADGTGGSLQ
jgi:predicted Zn-dependent protease